ncbi:MAG: hypothetical protein IJX68_04800 [Rikenellaceae bacterium]|nr:hypothetical protein [Rikenellaceae bacterium]
MEWKGFYDHYDELVKKWLSDDRTNHIENDPYFIAERNTARNKSVELSRERLEIPEPYFGDPNKCSAVIINLNPGTSGDVGKRGGYYRKLADELTNTKYSDFAKDFPCLEEKHPGYKFWSQKNRWIKRLCNLSEEDQLKPFAVELCPYHSTKWNGNFIDDNVRKYINDWVLEPAKTAVNKAKLPFALAIGKTCYNELTNNFGFDVKGEWTPDSNMQEWPRNKKGNVKRYFALLEKDGLKIWCTWCKGGTNSAPAESFTEIEKSILQNI